MKILKAISIILFIAFLIGCGSSGGGDGDDGGDDNSNTTSPNDITGYSYSVSGSNTFSSELEACYNPQGFGYSHIGSSSVSQIFQIETDFRYYIISIPRGHSMYFDTVQGGNGKYYGSNISGNASEPWSNISKGEPQDCAYTLFGANGSGGGGCFVVDTASDQLSSIAIYASTTANLADCQSTSLYNTNNIPSGSSLVGTWDLIANDGVAVPSGTSTLVLTSTTFSATRPDCHETGTYTTDGSTITGTTLTADGSDCDVPIGTVDTTPYTVNSTTLTTNHGIGGYSIWNRI